MVSDGQREVSDSGHRQRGPEERVEVHATERAVDRVQVWVYAVVDEHIRPEADPGTEYDEEASVPVNDNEDVDDEVDDADRVWEAALCFNPIKELHRKKCTSNNNNNNNNNDNNKNNKKNNSNN